MEILFQQLYDLLTIHSPSGKESRIIDYVKPIIKQHADVEFDGYGNLYAVKKLGSVPYTVLLSAHMDTVASMQPIPEFVVAADGIEIHNKNLLAGALGGDDKCGIAIILAILRDIETTDFKGTLKIMLSRQEELGCVGADAGCNLRPWWFGDIDCAIVLDRAHGNDVVYGMFDANFCHDDYAAFWYGVAKDMGFEANITHGTASDTLVFAEQFGINSVNLSTGYYSAHSSAEYIKLNELQRTVQWVLAGLNNIQDYVWEDFECYLPLSVDYYSDIFFDTCDLCETSVSYADMRYFDRFYLCKNCYDAFTV